MRVLWVSEPQAPRDVPFEPLCQCRALKDLEQGPDPWEDPKKVDPCKGS